jgi:hypothetical protein
MKGQTSSRYQALLDTSICPDPVNGPALLGEQFRHRQRRINMASRAPCSDQGATGTIGETIHVATFRDDATVLVESPLSCWAMRNTMPSRTQFMIRLEPP